MVVCLRVLKESNKSRFYSYSARKSALIISHITFRDCRVHSFSDNLSRNSCKHLLSTLKPCPPSPPSLVALIPVSKLKYAWKWNILTIVLLGRLKQWYGSSPLVYITNSVVKIFNLNERVTKNIELTSKVIVFPVKVVTKIFSRENRSKSNYAKFLCLNVTKKGVQMQDYCLNFEACKTAAESQTR